MEGIFPFHDIKPANVNKEILMTDKISSLDRFRNFMLAGFQYSNTYFLLNYIENGYKLDEATEKELYFALLTRAEDGIYASFKNAVNSFGPWLKYHPDMKLSITSKFQNGKYMGNSYYWYSDEEWVCSDCAEAMKDGDKESESTEKDLKK